LRIASLALIGASNAGLVFAADVPGTKHQISVKDLPKPYATPAVDNSSQTVRRAKGWLPQVLKGFTISAYVTGLSDPRWMALAPNGDVFLAEPDAGKITLLRDGKPSTFATGFYGRTASPSTMARSMSAMMWRCGSSPTKAATQKAALARALPSKASAASRATVHATLLLRPMVRCTLP